ncbi:hypothetical protein AKH15_07160 [Vibrio parahaemolyticus]|uniref:hypothetical protein n=1 Tax=Vibrio parahaemolyticus TaxID=670 RepID=UPI000813595F|nr:hypothetical protein [Vibrio parahaemolyticus]OCQ02092.1 hypothetical protein AKH15_07160 [Vibrio parahaemolyticus]
MKRNTTYTRVTNIPASVYEEARQRAIDNPIYEKSHRKEEANKVGCLGEVIAEYWMRQNGIEFTAQLEKTTHDYKLKNGKSFDVKTKDRRFSPRINYDCSVPVYNHTHQKSDYFLFISLERNKEDYSRDIRRFHTAYILGCMTYDEIDRVGIKFLAEEQDDRNGTGFWTDCLNVEMWQLIPIKETVEIFKGLRGLPSQEVAVNVYQINKMKAQIARKEIKDRVFPVGY